MVHLIWQVEIPPDGAGRRRTSAPDANPDAAGRRRRTSGRNVPLLMQECCDVASASWLSSDELRRVYSPVRIATSVLRIEITTGVYASVHSSMRGASNSAWASDEDNGSTWTYV